MLVRRGKARPRRWGGAVVEMAAVSPLFITMIFGMIESSRLGMVTQLLATASREGCRVAVINGKTTSDVTARINGVLSGSGISTGLVIGISPSNWSTAPGGTAITISVSVPYSNVGWLPQPYFLKGATVRASATMSSERP